MAKVTIWYSSLPNPNSLQHIPPDRILQTGYLDYYDGKQDELLLQQNDFPSSAVFNSAWLGRRQFLIASVVVNSDATPYTLQVVYDDIGTQFYVPDETLRTLMSDPLTIEVFRFDVNPSSVTVDQKRLETPLKALAAWEIQVWGEDFGKISMGGKIVGLNTDEEGNLVTRIVDSAGYRKFLRLKNLYIEDHAIRYASDTYRLGISYRNDIFIGHFDSFQMTENADDPFALDFGFIITTEQRVSSPHHIGSNLQERAIVDRATLQQLSSWSSERLGL